MRLVYFLNAGQFASDDRNCGSKEAEQRAHFSGVLNWASIEGNRGHEQSHGKANRSHTADDKQVDDPHAFGQAEAKRFRRNPAHDHHAEGFADQQTSKHEPSRFRDRFELHTSVQEAEEQQDDFNRILQRVFDVVEQVMQVGFGFGEDTKSTVRMRDCRNDR